MSPMPKKESTIFIITLIPGSKLTFTINFFPSQSQTRTGYLASHCSPFENQNCLFVASVSATLVAHPSLWSFTNRNTEVYMEILSQYTQSKLLSTPAGFAKKLPPGHPVIQLLRNFDRTSSKSTTA